MASVAWIVQALCGVFLLSSLSVLTIFRKPVVPERTTCKPAPPGPREAAKKDAQYFELVSRPRELAKADERLWIDSAMALEDVKSANISQWLKEKAIEFIEQGYVVIPRHVSEQQVDAALHGFDEWCDAKGSDCNVQFKGPQLQQGTKARLYNIHIDVPVFLELQISNPLTLQLIDYLFGRRSSIYTSILFTRGTSQPIHVDIPFFWTKPAAHYFGFWVALEDTDSENGPLTVLPKGHKCEILNQRAEIVKKKRGSTEEVKEVDVEAFYDYADATLENCRKMGISSFKEAHLKKGDALLWHPLLPHGGAQIKSQNRSRYSLVSHIIPEMMHVYRSDKFFNPDRYVPGTAEWGYKVVKDKNAGVQDYRLMMETETTFPK